MKIQKLEAAVVMAAERLVMGWLSPAAGMRELEKAVEKLRAQEAKERRTAMESAKAEHTEATR